MKEKEKIRILIEVLLTLREDAEMALHGDWNKSDKGFEDQIMLIDNTLKEVE